MNLLLKKWDDLPDFMRNDAVRPYYDLLKRRPISLIVKRLFDIAASAVLLLLLWPLMLAIAVTIRSESKGAIIFKQERVTRYGRKFKIWKFRTMVNGAEKIGSQVTVSNDCRITKAGEALRNSRLDELPQLINILAGNMSFVGTRPDVAKYVERYTDEMKATLLLPAGVTSEASIVYKDEYRLLSGADDVDEVYVTQVLPEKMLFNLLALRDFGIIRDAKIMFKTVFVVSGLLKEAQVPAPDDTAKPDDTAMAYGIQRGGESSVQLTGGGVSGVSEASIQPWFDARKDVGRPGKGAASHTEAEVRPVNDRERLATKNVP